MPIILSAGKEIAMKELLNNTIAILIITMLIAIMPTEAEGEIYEDTLRLHIIANSDLPEDQALKLKIRDFVLTEYGQRLSECGSMEEATAEIERLIDEINTAVSKKLAEMGYGYTVDTLLGQEWYDTREYEGFTLPSGYYTSLRIIIGQGEGQNWWCVMYPPLCLEIATENAPHDDGLIDYSREEIFLISRQEYQIKFKILEDLSRIFAKNG